MSVASESGDGASGRDESGMRATRRPRHIGLFGGSFDPVHDGHLHVARVARARFGLDRIVFMPAEQPPHKPGRRLEPGAHRLAMLHLAIDGEPGWSVSDLELRRGGLSYTIDTVRALPRELGEPEDAVIHLLIGSDNLSGLSHWREARALLERVQPIVIHRGGDPAHELALLRAEHGAELARKVEAGYLELAPVEVSSTQLRDAFARGAQEIEGVPAPVLAYIRAHGLYGARV